MPLTPPVTSSSQRFLSHWQAIGRGEVPHLRDYLGVLDTVLQPHMILLDLVAPDMIRFRLMANALAELIGIDLTGQNFCQFNTDPELSGQIWRAGCTVVATPCGLQSQKLGFTGAGRQVTIEMMSLPFRPFAGGPPAIGCSIEIVEKHDYRDRVCGLVGYRSAEWVDLGHGVPAERLNVPIV